MKKSCISFENKKGFTLIELVVVIAILAILAAIAVPAVISIIGSATSSSLKTQASYVDEACKFYYAGIKSGEINSSNFTASKSGDNIPVKYDSALNRVKNAKKCTVAGALEYGKMYDLVGKLEQFGYDSSGNIYVFGEDSTITLTQLKSDGSDTFTVLNYQ